MPVHGVIMNSPEACVSETDSPFSTSSFVGVMPPASSTAQSGLRRYPRRPPT